MCLQDIRVLGFQILFILINNENYSPINTMINQLIYLYLYL